MKPTAPALKYANLVQNLWNEQYLKGYQALNRCFGYAFREPSPDQKVFRPYLIRRKIEGR